MPIKKLKEFLDANHVRYVSVVHSQAYTAQEVAASAHVSGKAMAKTVIVELDGQLAMAVLPANRKIVLQDLREAWKPVTNVDFTAQSVENEPQLLRLMTPTRQSSQWASKSGSARRWG